MTFSDRLNFFFVNGVDFNEIFSQQRDNGKSVKSGKFTTQTNIMVELERQIGVIEIAKAR